MLTRIGNRAGVVSMTQKVVDQVAYAVAARVVLHPTGLKGGSLAIIGEDDQFLLRAMQGIDHILCQDMHISNGNCTQRFDRFRYTITGDVAALTTTGANYHLSTFVELDHPHRNQRSLAFTLRLLTIALVR